MKSWVFDPAEGPITTPSILVMFDADAPEPYVASGKVPMEIFQFLTAGASEMYRLHRTNLNAYKDAAREGEYSSTFLNTQIPEGNTVYLNIAEKGESVRMPRMEDGTLVLPIPGDVNEDHASA